jgi:hypothetical protein
VILDAVLFEGDGCHGVICGVHVDSYDWFRISKERVPR